MEREGKRRKEEERGGITLQQWKRIYGYILVSHGLGSAYMCACVRLRCRCIITQVEGYIQDAFAILGVWLYRFISKLSSRHCWSGNHQGSCVGNQPMSIPGEKARGREGEILA